MLTLELLLRLKINLLTKIAQGNCLILQHLYNNAIHQLLKINNIFRTGYKIILNYIWSYLWSNYFSAVIARQQLASFHVQYIMTDSSSQDIIKFYLCFINDNVRNFALKNYSITTLAPAVGCFIPRFSFHSGIMY